MGVVYKAQDDRLKLTVALSLALGSYDRRQGDSARGPCLPIHTAQDTIELVRPDGLAYCADVAAAAIQHLASGGS